MTRADLRRAMRFYLKAFQTGEGATTDATVHASVLTDEGYGSATPKRLYKGSVNFTIDSAGLAVPRWPAAWMEMTVRDLSEKLIPSPGPGGDA